MIPSQEAFPLFLTVPVQHAEAICQSMDDLPLVCNHCKAMCILWWWLLAAAASRTACRRADGGNLDVPIVLMGAQFSLCQHLGSAQDDPLTALLLVFWTSTQPASFLTAAGYPAPLLSVYPSTRRCRVRRASAGVMPASAVIVADLAAAGGSECVSVASQRELGLLTWCTLGHSVQWQSLQCLALCRPKRQCGLPTLHDVEWRRQADKSSVGGV